MFYIRIDYENFFNYFFQCFFLSPVWGAISEDCEFSHNAYEAFEATDRDESLVCLDPIVAQSEVCSDFTRSDKSRSNKRTSGSSSGRR